MEAGLKAIRSICELELALHLDHLVIRLTHLHISLPCPGDIFAIKYAMYTRNKFAFFFELTNQRLDSTSKMEPWSRCL